jgi:nucleolysin TIA-1/TIAR
VSGSGESGFCRKEHQKIFELIEYAPKLDYNEVWNRSSDSNSTVYVGGINGITEDLIRSAFAPYGQILAVHAFADRGYAFVRFANKDQACNAICGVHGIDVNGCTAKCSWGKENIDITNPSALSGSMSNNSYGTLSQQAANPLQAAQNAASNPWNPAAAANYQWAGYPPSTVNYWQQYPGYQK